MFAQPFDHSLNDLFTQFVDIDSSSVDGNKDVSYPSEFDQIFALDSLSSNCGDHSPLISTKPTQQSPQPWAKDYWCLSQETVPSAGQGAFAFQDTVHPSAVSNLSFNLENPPTSCPIPAVVACRTSSRSPSTPPATPRHNQKVRKSALNTPKSIRRQKPHDPRLPCKKTLSPSLIRSSQLQTGGMVYPEAWARGLQNFNIRSSDEHLPLSPPPSDILVQHENIPTDNVVAHMSHSADPAEMPHHYDSSIFNPSPAISMSSPSVCVLGRQQQGYLNQSHSALTTSSPPSADDIFSSPHSSDPQSLSSWPSESLGSSALSFTPELQNHDAQAWWPAMPSRVAPAQTSYQHMVASPAPQQPIQNTNTQHDLMQGGLMIQFDPSAFDVSTSADSSFQPTTMATAPLPQKSQPAYINTPVTPRKFPNPSVYATPQITNSSRSPSLSPRRGGSPSNRANFGNGCIMTTPQRRNGRKLSSQSMTPPKPVKGPSSTTSKSGPSKSLTVSFVNFTPSDSKKILTGVAPSGSSKTKARREQEARDRRRKLSEAAINAVRNAGGDVEALEAVLC
ncbi:developmental regulatory protein WetA [Aspergillus clavatus NRRL 1]|uniref:Developmental regulatory protein wetA n=1 Tax=Aspergillus clavatus (strain ATCC 1007 / CBS 513.65 / DSM 816 / NCTC 3887 / NRRL 1 / QM 1276 / 107) TaxID=344612 RepID=A1CIP3_ASPCL|nr:developmental regulatory protein WetA [Aspergillus clavatus NRRL 1]EAW10748.1 developmental regulatory protein WetA [Aspergillus clavatus NRRL 1]